MATHKTDQARSVADLQQLIFCNSYRILLLWLMSVRVTFGLWRLSAATAKLLSLRSTMPGTEGQSVAVKPNN
jgi:hypothetical protein